ncbi:CIC11C00000001990 [Sungouiella intermedia]|uniref:CIC11C00000001990 n=1 Tax=Sungouiella intermedia TaxID=45354 RepID=A0A1L0C5Q9_9ASCO|nr:CIC11C00000001990 [[Candida] intermedia]
MNGSERNSPMSSSETLSGSTSPHVLKLMNAPPQSKKQRSSSMNSIGSNHSTHNHRSMSIISLELPRNSIVSIDDNFLRPTRNNSSASLTSLAPLVSPNDTKDTYASHRMSKIWPKNNSAILSDDDSESETTSSRFKWRRRSSDKILKPPFLSSLKKDFKFKYDNHSVPKVSSAPPLSTKPLDDSTPSPLSMAHEGSSFHTHHHLHHGHLTNPSHLHHLQHFSEPDLDALQVSTRAGGKKLRNSSITQSIFLKKRLLLSKDIQFELLGPQLAGVSGSVMNEETRFPGVLMPMPLRGAVHNYLLLPEPTTLTPPTSAPMHTSPSPPLAGSSLSVSQSSPPREPQLLRQQNKLITELNRKWNRAFYEEDKRLADFNSRTQPGRSKKRVRSELVSSNDSFTTGLL